MELKWGQSTAASMSYQQQEPCTASSAIPHKQHVEPAPPTARATAEKEPLNLYQTSNSSRSSSAGSACVENSTEGATNSAPMTLSMGLTLGHDTSQQGKLECSSKPEYTELPVPQEAQAKQLVAPALSLDGTIWPRMAATEAVAPPVPSQQETNAAAPAAAGNRCSSFTVPPLKLSTSAETAAAAARPSLFGLETSLPTFDLLGSSNPSTPAQTKHPAAQHTAVLSEDPWTQNTARALRRTQQEVRALCTAQGLPFPAERPYCFDVVGIRAAGYGSSSNSRPIASCGGSSAAAAGQSNNCRSPGTSASGANSSAGMTSCSGSVPSTNGVRPAAATAVIAFQSLPGAESGSVSSLPSPATPAAAPAVPGLLQQLQQRRGQALLGQLQHQQQKGEQQQTEQQQQRQHSRKMHLTSAGGLVESATGWDETWPWQHGQGRGAQQQQQQQRCASEYGQVPYQVHPQVWQAKLRQSCNRPRSAGALVKANGAWCDTWPWHRKQQQQQQRRSHSSRDVTTRGQPSRMTRKAAQDSDGTNVDDLLRCMERSLAVHEQHLSKDAAACARPGGVSYQLPERWWETDSRALSDPLLLQMPVWMRQALELELMP